VFRFFGQGPCSGDATCVTSGDRYADGWPLVILIASAVTYLIAVFILQRGLTGRTVGSMLFAISVVGEDGRPLGIGRAALRSVAGAVDYLPCCIPIVGIVTIGATPSHQRVGDLAAGSRVVDARTAHSAVRTSTSEDRTAPHPAVRPVGPGESLPLRPPTSTPGTPPRPPGPLWDPSRQAYVLWDEHDGGWLQFDDSIQQWVRISWD
jgi:uncharacterized RDD family membrane protein YckC